MKKVLIGLTIAMLIAMSSMSLPVMAENLIDESVDKVEVLGDVAAPQMEEEILIDSTEAVEVEEMRNSTVKEAELTEIETYELSPEAVTALTNTAIDAFRQELNLTVPADYKALNNKAYEDEDEGITYALSLMPANWEENTSALADAEPGEYYFAYFGNVDTETGTGTLLGIQKHLIGNMDEEGVDPTEEQAAQMEQAARDYATTLGLTAGELLYSGKVSGSYPIGSMLTFALEDGKTITVTVGIDNTVSGYSKVEMKG